MAEVTQFRINDLTERLEFECDPNMGGITLVLYEVYWPDLPEDPDTNILTTNYKDAETYAKGERETEGLIRVRYVWGVV